MQNNNPITKQDLLDALVQNNETNNDTLRRMIKQDTQEIVEKATEELAGMVKRRFDEVDRRFDQMDTRFDKIETRLDTVESRVGIKKILFS